jgi:hypothetical protein
MTKVLMPPRGSARAAWFNMTSIDDDLTDFRSQAVAASEALLRTLPSGASLEKSGISYCLVRQPSLARLRTSIKVTAVACGVLGLSGLAIGGIFAFFLNLHLLPVAVCCSVGGILLMLAPTFVERWIVCHHLSQRDDDLEPGSQVKGIHISLEYAPTYGSMKLLAEDVGLIYIYPETCCVRIDGLSYEYVIQSKDVVGLSLHSDAKSVLLSYRVAEELLDLAIAPRSVLAELKRQTVGSSRGLFLKMRDALRLDEGAV